MTSTIIYQRSFFADLGGLPLDSGSVYIGTANADPEVSPIQCYWDTGLTTPAAQPLSVSAGYIVNAGTRAAVYVAAVDYSLRARNRAGVQVDYVANANFSAAAFSFLQAGTGAVSRTVLAKMRELEISPEDYGAAGDAVEGSGTTLTGTVDDAAFLAAFTLLTIVGGGTLRCTAGKVYRLSQQLTVPAGVRFNLNEAKLVLELSDASACGVQLRSNVIVENGHVRVISKGTPGAQAGCHAPIRVGPLYGSGGTVASPSADDNTSGWAIRNMIVESDKDLGAIATGGASGIAVIGNSFSGEITGISIADNAFMSVGISFDWGVRGEVASVQAIISQDSQMATNKTNFNAGNGFTTHPHNIRVSGVYIGRLTRPYQSGVGATSGSFGIRPAGCYGINVSNVLVEQTTEAAFSLDAGDLGFEFATGTDLVNAFSGNVFSNCWCANASTGNIVLFTSKADNVQRAIGLTITASISNGGGGAGTILNVTNAGGQTLAVGQTITGAGVTTCTISALGTGTGGIGTYTVTVAQNVASQAMTAGYAYASLHTWGALWATNSVFERVSGTRTSGTAAYGFNLFDLNGGRLVDCWASGCLNALRFSGAQKTVVEGGRFTGSSHENIKVEDSSSTIILRDLREVSMAGATYANVYFLSCDNCTIDGGIYGVASGETGTHTIQAVSGGCTNLSIVNNPTVLGHGGGSYACAAGSSSDQNTLKVFAGLTYGAGVTNKYAGQASRPYARAGDGVIHATGEGTPAGNVTASPGSTFARTDGGAGTTLYVKESGTGTAGWAAK